MDVTQEDIANIDQHFAGPLKFITWLNTRPASIQKLGRQCPIDHLYQIKATGQKVYVASYFEDGTMKVVLDGQFNVVMFNHFIDELTPDDLIAAYFSPGKEPCGELLVEEALQNDLLLLIESLPTDQRHFLHKMFHAIEHRVVELINEATLGIDNE